MPSVRELINEDMRHLGAILLDLAAAREHLARLDAKFQSASVGDHDELSDEMAKFDNTIDQLETEARHAIERDTGVSYDRISEANL